jgi:excisionase family DNA binding protein
MTATQAPTADERLLVTVKEAADMLSVSPRTLYNLLYAGEIRSVKLAQGRRVVVASLRAYVEREQQ